MDRVVEDAAVEAAAIPAALGVVVAGAAVWALSGPGGSVYRVPVNQLTIGTVSKGPFEDFIAVRGSGRAPDHRLSHHRPGRHGESRCWSRTAPR